MKVSIITVNFKSREKLIKCISSIRNNYDESEYEIIVVDNEKDEKLKSYLENKRKIKYIESFKNLGFSYANNLGAKEATGEFLFFLNPDTTVQKKSIEELIKFLIKHKDVGAVSPLLLNEKFKPFETQSKRELNPVSSIMSFSILRKFFPKKSIYKDSFFKSWDKHKPVNVDTLPGAALMIRNDLFKKINGFDDKFFLYFEENDLSKRIKELGFNLYVVPSSKILHWVGQSTKYLSNREKVFAKSRFYYLRKHFGLGLAIPTEAIIRINKYNLLITLGLIVGLIIRLENLSSGMPFIGDIGWFYISARDMLMDGKIPLVGITTSHLWLHQGPLWTYMLALVLPLFNFDPLSGAYLTITLGLLTTYLMYSLGKSMFSKNIAVTASLLYAVSPAIVISDRTPFDPSPIPLFSLVFFYAIYKFVKGKNIYFPLAVVCLAILYNLELATFSLAFVLISVLFFGFLKKKNWFKNIINRKILALAFFGGFTIMLPIFLYDLNNGFKQTIVFAGWVLYKPISVILKSDESNTNATQVANFFLENISKLILPMSVTISSVIFVAAILFLIYKIIRKKELALVLLFLFLIFGLGGIAINKTASDAYLPIIFPSVIYLIAILFAFVLNKFKITYLLIIVIFLLNLYSSYALTHIENLSQRVEAVDKIITLAKDQKFNLIGKGNESQHESFTKNYEYLLWWKGYPLSKNQQSTKLFIEETNGEILITKKQ